MLLLLLSTWFNNDNCSPKKYNNKKKSKQKQKQTKNTHKEKKRNKHIMMR